MQTYDDDEKVFEKAVNSILEYMRTKAQPSVDHRLRPQIDLTRQTWQLGQELVPPFPRVFVFESEIIKIGSVQKCLDRMLRRDFPRRLGIEVKGKNGNPIVDFDYRPFLLTTILGIYVDRYVRSYGLEFTDKSFKRVYDDMVTYVYSDQAEIIFVAPLYNFELRDIDGFSVNNYKVRRLNESEIEKMIEFDRAPGTPIMQGFGTIDAPYCVESVISTPRRIIPSAEPYISDFVTVLRIHKNGEIKYDNIFEYSKIWEASWGVSSSPKSTFKLGSKYSIGQEDIKPLTSLFQDFSRVKDHLLNPVKFSIRWLNKSYEEAEIMDRLLDLTIALEVLFGVSNRLDLYVAHFIGSNKEERIELNRDISRLREARNSIAHAGNYAGKQEFVGRVEGILRQCLQKFLGLLGNLGYKEIIMKIKNSIAE